MGSTATPGFTPISTASATNSTVAVGANQLGLGATVFSPSDSTGAIGPNHYIEAVNTAVGLFDRNLQQIGTPVNLGAFIGLTAGNIPTDPQIQWDQQGGRWLYAALEVSGSSGGMNLLHLGWSKNGDPSGLTLASSDWCSFAVSTGAALDDFPKLGHDANFLLIGANVFSNNTASATFQTATVWAIPKPASGVSSCTAPTAFQFGTAASPLRYSASNDLVFTPVPANVADASSTAYIVSLDETSGAALLSSMGVFHVSPASACPNPAAPCLVGDGNITVNAWSSPPLTADWTVAQPGGAPTLDALIGQLTQAVQVADPASGGAEAVWTQHTNGVSSAANAQTVVTWYELLPGLCAGGTCPAGARRQEGVIGDPILSAFNAAISADSRGENAVVEYNIGGATSLVALAVQDRNISEPPNATFRAQTLAVSGVTDTDFSCTPQFRGPPCRWGDYPGASPDPVVRDAAWGTNMLAGTVPANGGAPTWTTRNFSARRWEPVPLTLAPATGPDVASWGPGRLDAFGQGAAGDLQHAWASGAGPNGASWGGPESLGGVLTAAPGAVSWGLNRIDVFVRGADDQLYHKWWDGSQWSGYAPLGGVLSSGPDVSSWASNRLDVFVQGADRQLYHTWWDGSQWNGFQLLGGVLSSEPAAVSWAPNRIDVFVRGTDNQLYHKWWDGSQWNGFEALGGALASGPDAASCASGQLEVVALDGNGAVIRQTFNGSWSGWRLVGGSAAGDPAATCGSGLGLNLLTEGLDNTASRASIN